MKLMIICSCNVFSDTDVRSAVNGAGCPKTPAAVYKCLGCSPSCGRCLGTVKAILQENSSHQAASREPAARCWRSTVRSVMARPVSLCLQSTIAAPPPKKRQGGSYLPSSRGSFSLASQASRGPKRRGKKLPLEMGLLSLRHSQAAKSVPQRLRLALSL